MLRTLLLFSVAVENPDFQTQADAVASFGPTPAIHFSTSLVRWCAFGPRSKEGVQYINMQRLPVDPPPPAWPMRLSYQAGESVAPGNWGEPIRPYCDWNNAPAEAWFKLTRYELKTALWYLQKKHAGNLDDHTKVHDVKVHLEWALDYHKYMEWELMEREQKKTSGQVPLPQTDLTRCAWCNYPNEVARRRTRSAKGDDSDDEREKKKSKPSPPSSKIFGVDM